MNLEPVDIIALGNAIIDTFYQVDDSILDKLNLQKGSMTLISAEQLTDYKSLLPDTPILFPGGSAANSILGLSQLGKKDHVSVGYISTISDDHEGQYFLDRMSYYVHTQLIQIQSTHKKTGQCLVFVTPDGERTMATYLGVCDVFMTTPEQEQWASRAQLVFFEGYLCGAENALHTLTQCATLIKKNKKIIALSLGSVSLIQAHFDTIDFIFKNFTDIIVGTVEEGLALTQKTTVQDAMKVLQENNCIGALTDGGNGVYVFDASNFIKVPSLEVKQIVDTTGAGDQFAAGYLYGIFNKLSIEESAHLGVKCACDIIQKMGSYPL